MEPKVIALAGNPNVGKSTVFNGLTGLNQHTGNWPGKTVSNAQGKFTYKGEDFAIVDIPGAYSLMASSAEEEVARDFICSGKADLTVVVIDATCVERNLNLVLQILDVTKNVIICVNLLDEAKKKKIHVDLGSLSYCLGVPVVGVVARSKKSLWKLKEQIYHSSKNLIREEITSKPIDITEEDAEKTIRKAKALYETCVTIEKSDYNTFDRRVDSIVTSKIFGIPIMLCLLGVIFWITLSGANYPSAILSYIFNSLEGKLLSFFMANNAPEWLTGALILGVYKTLTWVVSVMLPPMAIFFPLFTLLEDFGYLPRVAFNMDHFFRKASAHGKQALTMCMGFGCNACGVMGCRIIDSPRERLIAVLTNNFVPCNGRFPTLIAIISMFFVASDAGSGRTVIATIILTGLILFGIFTTLFVSKILSSTILKGIPSSFALELPPYRRPQFGKVIVRSVLDRTLFVLGRAVIVAAPAGLIIWIMANTYIAGVSLLDYSTNFLDPFASVFGLDGVILMAFILGFPANEIVVPIIIMCYMSTGNILELSNLYALKQLLIDNGWTGVTALCTMLLCLLHFPCGTTCLTIRKETQSLKWTAVAFAIPTITGLSVCFVVATLGRLFI